MTDILRNNWFVVLIAIIIIGFIGYFIYDTNKDNVSAKTTNNEQVVASINKDDITADDLYDESTPYDGSTIYNMYKNAVIDQSIKTTKDLKKQVIKMLISPYLFLKVYSKLKKKTQKVLQKNVQL